MIARSTTVTALSLALACASCHDWDGLTRERTADGGNTGEDASTTGNFACRAPFALIGVWGGGVRPQIARFELSQSPANCEPIAVRGFSMSEPIRALAVDGDRVLVLGDSGACIQTVSATSVSEQCAPYPFNVGAATPLDAFVRINPARRFAATFAIGTAGSVSHVLVEDDQQHLTQQLTINGAGLSTLTAGVQVRSIVTSPESPYRLFALRDDREEVVSAEQDNTGRSSLLSPSDPPGLYAALGVGPSNALGPMVTMLLRDSPSTFAMVLNRTKFPSNNCSECSRLVHVIPVNDEPRQQLLACDDATGRPRVLLRGASTSCDAGPEFPSGSHVSRMAIRWQ